MRNLMHILNDGGIYITYPIIVLLLVNVFIFFRGVMGKYDLEKTKSLIASIAWFVIAWAYMGRTLGFIQTFDKVSAAGDVSPQLLAGGIKMALVGPLVGLIVFLISKAGIIYLILRSKK